MYSIFRKTQINLIFPLFPIMLGIWWNMYSRINVRQTPSLHPWLDSDELILYCLSRPSIHYCWIKYYEFLTGSEQILKLSGIFSLRIWFISCFGFFSWSTRQLIEKLGKKKTVCCFGSFVIQFWVRVMVRWCVSTQRTIRLK